ncbi:MAG: hypothetical protein C0501_31535 [Isosphaera sp.]|nr:hypothetical protein [Isosphaera sp.]
MVEFHQVCGELGIPPEGRSAHAVGVADEFARQLPAFVRMLTILVFLPELYERFRRTFLRCGLSDGNREPLRDAEIQAAEAVGHIVQAFSGPWCRGNAGAWVAQIRNNVLHQALRGTWRQDRLGHPTDPGVLETRPDHTAASVFLEAVTERERLIVELSLKGTPPTAIAAATDTPEEVVEATIRRVRDRLL